MTTLFSMKVPMVGDRRSMLTACDLQGEECDGKRSARGCEGLFMPSCTAAESPAHREISRTICRLFERLIIRLWEFLCIR